MAFRPYAYNILNQRSYTIGFENLARATRTTWTFTFFNQRMLLLYAFCNLQVVAFLALVVGRDKSMLFIKHKEN